MTRTHEKAESAIRRTTVLLVALVATAFLAIAFAACSSGGGDGGDAGDTGPADGAAHTDDSEAGAQTVDIVSKGIAFDKSEIKVAAGAKITIRSDNQDEAIPHNFAIYKTSDAKEKIAATEIEPGPVKQELTVDALEPGEYFFRCDTHPQQMTGTLIVEG